MAIGDPSFHDEGTDTQWHADDQDGLVSIVNGPLSGEVDLTQADARITGRRRRNWNSDGDFNEHASTFGRSIAAGDLNGDGLDDLILGSYHGCEFFLSDDKWGLAEERPGGEAYVFFGPLDGTLAARDADLIFIAEGAKEGVPDSREVGWSVAHAGDVDGDGASDLLIGATGIRRDGFDFVLGGAYLLYGPLAPGGVDLADADATLLGEGLYQFATTGSSVAGAGDLDADGFDDLIIGAPGDGQGGSLAGAAFVVYGGPGF